MEEICHYLGAHFDNIENNAWRSDLIAFGHKSSPPSPTFVRGGGGGGHTVDRCITYILQHVS